MAASAEPLSRTKRYFAFDKVAYFGEHLSDNIAATPEGYRICRNAVIGRSGFQKYRASEIADPDGLLGNDYGPDDEIDLWRDPEEVFSPATLASFEGKTFTLSHPSELLNPETEQSHHAGHVQNVRRGAEALDSGDWPILADIVVTDAEAIRAIDAGERELSCGYTYQLAKRGYRWEQQKILGNHVALVLHGRAGSEARIYDSAAKEKPVTNLLKHIFGLGLKTYAKDANPEDVAAAVEEVRSNGHRSIARDDDDNHRRSHDDDDKRHGKDDGKEEENRAAMDRKRLHDALDRMLDDGRRRSHDEETEEEKKKAEDARRAKDEEEKKKAEEEESKKAEDDADVKELRRLMGEHLKEEEKEPEHSKDDAHPEGCRCDDCMDKRRAKDESEEKEEKKEEGEDAAEIVRAEPVLSPEDRPKSVFDAAVTMDLLRAFKPIVAKSKDKKVQAAFDTLFRGFRAAMKQASGNGSYATFRRAASTLDKDKVEKAHDEEFKPKESPLVIQQRENDQIYAEAGKKMREKAALTRR